MILPGEALLWCSRLLAAAAMLQSWELWLMRPTWQDDGVWRWNDLRQDFQTWPAPLRGTIESLLAPKPFAALVILRLLASLALSVTPSPWLAGWIFVTTLLTAWRWRGSLNGGSDAMTLMVAGSVTVGLAARGHPKIVLGALWFLTLQLTLSYFVAGLAKLRNPAWRKGEALSRLVESGRYAVPGRAQKILRHPLMLRLATWALLAFETLFPLALLNSETGLWFLKIGLVFHLMNVYLLGLNRFFWIWMAAYPAFLFCCLALHP